MDKYAQATTPKVDTKVIVIGVWFLIVFGLMGAFILTTNQNTGPGAPPETAPNQQSGTDAAAKVKAVQDQLAKDPNNSQLMMEFGYVLLDAGKYQDAAANLQRAITLSPNNAETQVGLGIAYQYLNRPTDALAQFDKALAIDPNHELAKVRKGFLLADVKGDYAGAIKLLREVEAKQPIGTLKLKLQNQITAYEKKLGK